MCDKLDEKAKAIWDELGENERSNAATTIAVTKCTNKDLYCTANDVDVISEAAEKKAEEEGVSKLAGDLISKAGIGLHAEMWPVQHVLAVDPTLDKVKETLIKVGASRASCKYCSLVLDLLGVGVVEKSVVEYQSWTNPLTNTDDQKPREGFKHNQQKAIPDLRQHGINYWYKDQNGKLTQDPQGV